MDWVYNHLLLPVLNVLYVPCDWVLGWTARFSPVVGISIVGVISGLAIILVQKYGSNQRLLAACKADLKLLKKRMKEARAADDKDALRRARALSGRIGGKYMGASLKPALWTVPLIGVIGLWTGSRLGYLPIRPGQEIEIAAHFEAQTTGYAYVLPGDAFIPVGPPIAAIGDAPCLVGPTQATDPHAKWRMRARKEGVHRLTIRGGGRSYEVDIPVAARGGRPPEPVTRIGVEAVELKLEDSLPSAWWNLKLQWGGLYLIVAVGAALALRPLLRVN